METRRYMSIWEPPWRPVWCLFLFWCNIKSSLNERCCWQSGSKRTTNHAKKSMFVQVQINKTGWVTRREWKGSGKIRDRGTNPKMAERSNTGSLRRKKHRTQGWNWISLRAGRGEQKQVISKHKFKSLCNETGEGEDITLLLRVSAGRGKAFPPRGWVEQEALVRHVWTEVILYASHAPAGQLILGQVKAEAAQLENCSLGFRSLRETTGGECFDLRGQEREFSLWLVHL